MDVIAFSALRVGLPITVLYCDALLITTTFAITMAYRVFSPAIMGNLIMPWGMIESLVNSYKGWVDFSICYFKTLILVRRSEYRISIDFPLSTKILQTVWLPIIVSTTNASFCRKCTPFASSSIKIIYVLSSFRAFDGLVNERFQTLFWYTCFALWA